MRKLLPFLGICALLAAQALAADVDAEIQTTFIKPWMDAVQSKDPAKVMPFFHPKTLACLNDRTREYFDFVARQEVDQEKVKGTYRVTKIAPLPNPAPVTFPADSYAYPVEPTYEIQVEFGDTAMLRDLAPVNGKWYEVYPCPNEKGIAQTHEFIEKGSEQRNRAMRLASELKEPLLTELKEQVKQKQLIEAIKKYRQSTGADLTTAEMVIRVLQKQVAAN